MFTNNKLLLLYSRTLVFHFVKALPNTYCKDYYSLFPIVVNLSNDKHHCPIFSL